MTLVENFAIQVPLEELVGNSGSTMHPLCFEEYFFLIQRAPSLLKRFVPFGGMIVANGVNIPTMRQRYAVVLTVQLHSS